MVQVDTARTQKVVQALMNSGVNRDFSNRNRCEMISLSRPKGRNGRDLASRKYDFGNEFSVPAIVQDGQVKRLDGRPYKG